MHRLPPHHTRADGSGTIDEEEFVELCTMVNNGSPVFPGNFLRALEEFDTNDDGLIDFEEFTSLNNRYPIVLFPAFRLQQALQVHTLGEKEWTNIAGKVNQKRLAEIYARKHGGMPPPSFKTNLVVSGLVSECRARVLVLAPLARLSIGCLQMGTY